MKKVRIDLEKFINVKGKIIFFGEKKPLKERSIKRVLDVFKLLVKKKKRIIILTDSQKYLIEGIVATRDICQFLLKGENCDYCANFPSHYAQIYEQPISVLMNTAVLKLRDGAPLFVGVHVMNEQNIGTLPLIDKYGDLVGIITERHIAFLLADTKKNVEVKVREIMSPNVITCTKSHSIADALQIICTKGFRRLPVVEKGSLVGYFTVKDLLHYFVRDDIVKLFKAHTIPPIFHEKVTAIMQSPVFTIEPDVSITEFAKGLKKKNIGAMPVIEDEKLIGIITEHDITEAMAFPRVK